MGMLVLCSVLSFTVALTPACKDADAPLEVYRAFALGANVIPTPASHADASVMASVLVVLSSAGRIGYAYSVFAAPSGTIDLIALYEAAAGDTLPAIATAVLCDGTEACAASRGRHARDAVRVVVGSGARSEIRGVWTVAPPPPPTLPG